MKQLSLERAAWALLLLHAAISLFGLVGIAVMLPNPQIWSGSSAASALFPLAVQQGGNLQILAGAGAVFAFGAATLGWRPTLIFFAVSAVLSMAFELMGTSIGFPFGNYEYTEMFGYKFLDKVPPAIPLSWFFMGLTSLALAASLLRRWRGAAGLVPSILLGSVLLTAWDVVLDPAMAHETLAIRYWVWEDTGVYMGMPSVNFVGWLVTGAVFMAAASLFDRRLRPVRVEKDAFFLLVYLCNLLFGIGICIGTGLWLPAVLGFAFCGLIMLGWFRPALGVSAVSEEA